MSRRKVISEEEIENIVLSVANDVERDHSPISKTLLKKVISKSI